MFWKKDRNKEQQEQARKAQETTQKNRDLQEEVKKLQEQIIARANEARQEKEKAQSQQVQGLRQEVKQLRQKLQEAEKRAEAQREPEVDIEELPAAQQAEARAKAEQELREARQRIDELEQVLGHDDDAPPAPTPGGLAVGSTAWVRKAGGKGLNRRDAPGTGSNVQDSLAIGTQLSLLEGPVSADGYTWWRVRVTDGREGWVAGEELVTHPE